MICLSSSLSHFPSFPLKTLQLQEGSVLYRKPCCTLLVVVCTLTVSPGGYWGPCGRWLVLVLTFQGVLGLILFLESSLFVKGEVQRAKYIFLFLNFGKARRVATKPNSPKTCASQKSSLSAYLARVGLCCYKNLFKFYQIFVSTHGTWGFMLLHKKSFQAFPNIEGLLIELRLSNLTTGN